MKNGYFSTKKLVFVALFTAMNILMSSSFVSIPVPGGHFYLNDIIICLCALVFDPFSAFIIGGAGAFIGDLIFYPTPMFVTLVVRSVQAVTISLIAHKKEGLPKFWVALLALLLGAVIMIGGYSVGRAFIYSTPEYALLKLPYQAGQALIGVIIALILLYKSPVKRLLDTIPKE